MAIPLNDNIHIKAPKLIDKRESLNGEVPYTSIQEAVDTIPKTQRSRGLLAYIDDGSGLKRYWYRDGIEDADLVEASPDFTILTDHTLYFNPTTKKLSLNLVDYSESFIAESGTQEFQLTYIPRNIVHVAANGVLLEGEVAEQYEIDQAEKKLIILDELETGDVIQIRYEYLIR